jgi:predicted ATPase
MICLAFDGWARSLMGCLDTGARLAEAAIAHARARTNPHSLAFGLVSSGFVFVYQGDVERAAAIGDEVIALAALHGMPQWLGFGQEIRGWATLRQGDAPAGIRLQEAGLRDLVATGARTHLSRMLVHLAESYLLVGDAARARTHLTAAHEHRQRHGEHYYAAEAFRLQARLLELEEAAPDQIETCFAQALETARRQRASFLELRAATSLARFRVAQGTPVAAREVLAPALESLREGFDWPPVTEARALLNDINQVTLPEA